MQIIQGNTIGFITPGQLPFCEREETCNYVPKKFCQKYNAADKPELQVSLDVFDPTDLLADGAFGTACGVNWTCGANWLINVGKAFATGPGGSSIDSEALTIKPFTLYRIKFDIANLVGAGGLVSFTGVSRNFTANGSFEFYYFTDGSPSNALLKFFNLGSDFDVDNAEVVMMESVGYYILDSSGNTDYVEFEGETITYFDTLPLANIKLKTEILSDDQYCVQLINTATVFEDGDFGTFEKNITGMLAGGNFNISQSNTVARTGTFSLKAQAAGALPGGPNTEEVARGNTTLNLLANQEYIIRGFFNANVAAYDPQNEGDVFFDLQDFSDATILDQEITWNDTFDLQQFTEIRMRFKTGTDTTGKIKIMYSYETVDATLEANMHFEDVSIHPVGQTSECLDIKTAHDCTLFLTWTSNDLNANGFNYENAFTQNIRVEALLKHPQYPKQKETHRNSNGERKILYVDTSIRELLTFEEIPDWMHTALAFGVDADIFTIDGVEYVFEEDAYEPDWRNSSSLAPVEIEVFKKDQNFVNDNC